MFEYIEGTLSEKGEESAVLDVHGVGYELLVPASTISVIPEPGQKVRLYTHFHVREDQQRLFGFFTKAEREAFRHLIAVNQVGPKVALNVLSGLSVQEMVIAVQTGDTSRFRSISGIGPKTAQRLVLELKGKLHFSKESLPTQRTGKAGSPDAQLSSGYSKRRDVYEALLSLGYSETQVINGIKRVEETIEPNAPVEEWIKKALRLKL